MLFIDLLYYLDSLGTWFSVLCYFDQFLDGFFHQDFSPPDFLRVDEWCAVNRRSSQQPPQPPQPPKPSFPLWLEVSVVSGVTIFWLWCVSHLVDAALMYYNMYRLVHHKELWYVWDHELADCIKYDCIFDFNLSLRLLDKLIAHKDDLPPVVYDALCWRKASVIEGWRRDAEEVLWKQKRESEAIVGHDRYGEEFLIYPHYTLAEKEAWRRQKRYYEAKEQYQQKEEMDFEDFDGYKAFSPDESNLSQNKVFPDPDIVEIAKMVTEMGPLSDNVDYEFLIAIASVVNVFPI